jgi:predicted small metal-binding protein
VESDRLAQIESVYHRATCSTSTATASPLSPFVRSIEGKYAVMSYTIRCADSGSDCPGEFATETREELDQHVEMHIRTAHPDMVIDESTKAAVDSLVHQR